MKRLLGILAFHAAILGTLELALRWTAHHRPSYYMQLREGSVGGVLHYPYGDIVFNRDGFPDVEFGEKKSARVGYFGDSIAFGVGAGMGHRISDHLRTLLPAAQHLTFAGLGDGLTREGIARVLELSARYHLNQVVYLMDLDDILPSSPLPADEARVVVALGWIRRELDGLRAYSYLYSYARTAVADLFTERGFGTTGTRAYELFPVQYHTIVEETAVRIREAKQALAARGVSLVVVVLPYEMQVSEEAARVYGAHGIRWEGGFTDGSPQQALRNALPDVTLIDAAEAFPDHERVRLGQYFVYDRGEKLDWIHPNRLGHARIAEYLADTGEIVGTP